jgi:hypothetical protein
VVFGAFVWPGAVALLPRDGGAFKRGLAFTFTFV